jgi:hydrogenase nickel incorporation protein HypA/HybF
MHEMALTRGIIEAIEENAALQGFSAVKGVWIEMGRLACVEPAALRFAFDAAAHGTIAEGARLEIVATDGAGWCIPCGKPVALAQRFDPCPDCGGHQIDITSGGALRITELEVC